MYQSIKDETGNTYTRLTVSRCLGSVGGKALWECLCSCGRIVKVTGDSLRRGSVKSCGCYRKDRPTIERKHGHSNAGGAVRINPTYSTWTSMITRCYNPNRQGYQDYGGSGITVCDRWRRSYLSFLEDMGRNQQALHLIGWTTVRGTAQKTVGGQIEKHKTETGRM